MPSLNNRTLTYHPLTPDRWKDVEGLFGQKGASEGCWCVYWKQKQSEDDATRGGVDIHV